MTAFAAANAAIQYVLARTPQGHAASCAGASLVLKLILYGILKDGFNFTYVDNICLSDYSFEGLFQTYVAVLERARYYNLVLKMSDVVVGYTCTDQEPFQVLGLEIGQGKIRIPREKVSSFSSCEFPRTKKAIQKLIGNIGFYSQFSTGFAEALFHLREELQQQKGKKFIFTNKMDKLVKVLLEMIANSSGLLVLSREQYMSSTFILFCDSSKNSWGAALLCLVNDELWPIVAVSKSHSKNAQKYCINKKELLAICHASNDLHLLLQNRPHFVATDSSFAKHCLTKPIEEIGSKIKTAVILYRERFFSRILKLSGENNGLSDIASRYLIPSAAATGITSDHDTKIIKWHMKVTKINDNVKRQIETQQADLMNPQHVTLEDEITNQAQSTLPECYTLNEAESDDSCDGTGICCTFKNEKADKQRLNVLAESEQPLSQLKTIHRINDEIKAKMAGRLTDVQLSRLNQAEFVIIEMTSQRTTL